MNLKYPELGDKRKQFEKYEKSCKKRKVDKTNGTYGLTNDDYNLILDRMEEVAIQICKNVDERHTPN